VAQKKARAPLTETLRPAEDGDVIELDEMWSFVQKKANKRWLWVALCRRTRQVVAFFLGDRGEGSCRRLFERIPESYRSCQSYSDFWAAYQTVFPDETHQPTEKGSGQTSRLERWNCHILTALGALRTRGDWPSRNPTRIIGGSRSGSSMSTTKPYRQAINHYR
jgi:IS1 family transposase